MYPALKFLRFAAESDGLEPVIASKPAILRSEIKRGQGERQWG
jgi:hypothetical protein